jgi:hypothetical protein
MQSDRDVSPSLAGGEEEGYIPIARPGKAYFTIHPHAAYELTWPVIFDYRKSGARQDPYLVMRDMWSKFPPSLLRVKRLLLCQSFQDEVQRPFIWMADWHETSESPSELHKSIARVIAQGRQGWGQALFQRNVYQWARWPDAMGESPIPIWPEQDFFEILEVTLHDRIIATPDHELIACIGQVQP